MSKWAFESVLYCHGAAGVKEQCVLLLKQQNLNCSVFTLSCFFLPLKSLVQSAARCESQEVRMSHTQRVCVLSFKDERQKHVISGMWFVFELVCPVSPWLLGTMS